jgi:glycine oxidase
MSAAGSPVIVLGGGIIGAATTWRLAVRGLEVTWVRPDSNSGTATAAAGAMLSIYSEVAAHEDADRTKIEVDFRRAGRIQWDEWISDISAATGADIAVNEGVFVVGTAAADRAGLAAIVAAAAVDGAVSEIGPEEVPGLSPSAARAPYGALYLATEASTDSAVLLTRIAAAIERCPSATVLNGYAQRLELSESAVTVVLTDGRSVAGDQLVVAAGVATEALLNTSGISGLVPPLLGGRGVSLLVQAPEPIPRCVRTPNRVFGCGLHLLPRADGTTYLGATNRLTTRPEPTDHPTLDEIGSLISAAAGELNRGLRRATLISSAVGNRPVTFDRMPLVGRTNHPRVLVATGTWRNGIGLAPVIADLLARELGEPGSTAEHPFAPTRTVTGEPLDAQTVRRSAAGIVESLLNDGSPSAARAEELTGFIATMLAQTLQSPDAAFQRAADRLIARAPMEEALPLLFELAARWRS